MRTRPQVAPARSDKGQVTAFLAVFVLALFLLAGLVLDGGLALSARLRALNQAQAAARAGAQALDLETYRRTGEVVLDPAQARAAAYDYLRQLEISGATVTVSRQTVTVTVRDSQPTQLLGLVGINTIEVAATATAAARRGVTEPVP